MPELPEVEVLRRSLEPLVLGDRVTAIRVDEARLRERVDLQNLEALTLGRKFLATRRRAKYLLLELERGSTAVVHLGMSGRLTVTDRDSPLLKHEHVSFELESGRRLRFSDTRRFGLVFALESRDVETDRHFSHLGIEPLDSELSGDFLRATARGRRGPVKTFLMNGQIVVGVGNIYACEALYRAGIHPSRSVSRISIGRWCRLADAVRTTLQDAIDQGGTTLNDFADALGQEGYFRVALDVYGRGDETCNRCGGTVRRIVQAGRSTFYCPGCQH